MAWNQSGGGNDQDPWSGKRRQQGPPDLDKLIREFKNKLSGGNSDQDDGSGNGGPGINVKFLVSGVAIALFVLWVISGFFIVRPAEQAVILRFGKYVETVGPGPHWIPAIIDSYYKIDEQQVDTYAYTADMLTRDENIVNVSVAVQYRKANANDFLFNVLNPVESLKQATASSLRQVIGNTTLDEVLTSGRAQVRSNVQQQLTTLLAKYETGIEITDVALQPARAPEEVKDAFDDAIKAQEDEQRFINQAQAYEKQVVPEAEGKAQRLDADAGAYREQVVLNATGETARFLAVLPEYQREPKVTRERLYLSAIEAVMNHSTKVMVDVKNGNNLMYLPIDQLLKQSAVSTVNIDVDKKEQQSMMPLVRQHATKMNSLRQSSNTSSRPSRPNSYLQISQSDRISR